MHPYKEAQRLIKRTCAPYDVSLVWGWGARHPYVDIRSPFGEYRQTYPFNGGDPRQLRNIRAQVRRALRAIKAKLRVSVQPMERNPMSKTFAAALLFSTNMADAPQAEQLILIVPTGDPNDPITYESGWWAEAGMNEPNAPARWEGEWRFADVPYASNEPIAWASWPDIDSEIEDLARAAVANKAAA